ncbi:hypothetical protein ACFX2J_043300 [Malus domestica]
MNSSDWPGNRNLSITTLCTGSCNTGKNPECPETAPSLQWLQTVELLESFEEWHGFLVGLGWVLRHWSSKSDYGMWVLI